MDHMGHSGDGYHEYHHHHHDPSQGQAHQGGHGDHQAFADQGQAHQGGHGGHQGLSDQGQAHQGGHGDHQGVANQGGAHQGGGGQGFQDPSNQGFPNNGTANQGPFQQIGGGSHPPPQPPSQPSTALPGISGGPPPVILAPLLVNRPKTNTRSRPKSSSQYSVLSSPTLTNFSVDHGLIDETSIPAQGTMIVGPPSIGHRSSSASSSSLGHRSSSGRDGYGQDLEYSPRTKQTLLDQTRYHDSSSTQHMSSRVLPISPRIATIPSAQVFEIRAPQEGHSEAVGSIVSTGNVSSLNTFDRRHPQAMDDNQNNNSLFSPYSRSSRNPEDA
ncbi:hypothetical protein BGZ54_002107 [Gamsiella multidivaricata]|nr:hypothetical protein BGZ54_002107 [Gamsiella multidivaricata]